MPVLLIILPFAFLSFGIILNGQEAGLIISALAILSWMVKDKTLRCFFLYVAGWVLWARIDMVLGGNAGIVALGFGSYLIVGLAVYLGAARYGKRREWLLAIRAAALMQGVLCCIQFFGYWPVDTALMSAVPVDREYEGLMTGTLGCPTFVMPFLAISAFFFTGRWKWALPVIVLPIIFSGSAGAIVGLLAGFAMKARQVKASVAVIAAGAAVLWWDPTASFQDVRWEWWDMAWEHIKEAPILGHGPGIRVDLGTGNNNLHNDWLTLWLNCGSIGVGLLVAWFIKIWRHPYFPAMVAAAVCACSAQLMYIPVSAFLVLLIAGLIERDNG